MAGDEVIHVERHREEVFIIMLQARTSDHVFVTLAHLTTAEIDVHREQSLFYCPICHEPVMIKAGIKVIPHFAHHAKTNCPSYQGGEGPYHERGKLLLYEWLKAQQINVQLEVYLKEIQQQPDLLLTINNRHIALEFQSSRIPVSVIKQRNIGYEKANIIPIWLLGANQFERQGEYHLKVNRFTLQFMQQFSLSSPLMLFYFCPLLRELVTFQDVYLTNQRLAMGRYQFHPLDHTSFTDIFKEKRLRKPALFQLWKEEKRNMRLRPRQHISRMEWSWHQWLYRKRTHFEHLSSLIHLPVRAQYRMKSPPWNWQSRICLDVIDPLPIGSHFSLKECERTVEQDLYSIYHYPLIRTNENPIRQYLQLLQQLNFIIQTSPDQFRKVKPLESYEHIEQSIRADVQVMDELIIRQS